MMKIKPCEPINIGCITIYSSANGEPILRNTVLRFGY